MWVRKLFQERKQKGEFNILIKDMKLFDSEWFFRYFRMSPTTFEHLLSWVYRSYWVHPSPATI